MQAGAVASHWSAQLSGLESYSLEGILCVLQISKHFSPRLMTLVWTPLSISTMSELSGSKNASFSGIFKNLRVKTPGTKLETRRYPLSKLPFPGSPNGEGVTKGLLQRKKLSWRLWRSLNFLGKQVFIWRLGRGRNLRKPNPED